MYVCVVLDIETMDSRSELLCLYFLISTVGASCIEGWFGSHCEYKCHCTGNKCLTSGQCSGSKCESEWFGPNCQYEDLVKKNGAIISVPSLRPELTLDDNDDTCTGNVTALSYKWNEPVPFTWLRLTLKKLESVTIFKIDFLSDNKVLPCRQQRHFRVSERSVDIYCSMNSSIKEINIYVDIAREFCSFHVSGGRNLALKQNTSVSSFWSELGVDYIAAYAVDGDRSNLIENRSCAHTNKNDYKPTWTLTFSKPVLVTRYVLYNRNFNSIPSPRLKGFRLQSFTEDNDLLFNYQDPINDTPKYIYTVMPNITNTTTSFVEITATNKDSLYLELCEVEIYGEIMCSDNKFGFDCNETCDCPVKCESSYNRSLGCPLCSHGYEGYLCDRKETKSSSTDKYGFDCNVTCDCSQKCESSNNRSISPSGYPVSTANCKQNQWTAFTSFVVIGCLSSVIFILLIIIASLLCSRMPARRISLEKSSASRRNQYVTSCASIINDGENVDDDSFYTNVRNIFQHLRHSKRVTEEKDCSYLKPVIGLKYKNSMGSNQNTIKSEVLDLTVDQNQAPTDDFLYEEM